MNNPPANVQLVKDYLDRVHWHRLWLISSFAPAVLAFAMAIYITVLNHPVTIASVIWHIVVVGLNDCVFLV
jgi:hypothetical protein